MKKIILLLGIVLLFSACSKSSNELLSKSNSGKLSMTESPEFDFNDINIKGGQVEHIFKMKNDGPDDLIIKSAYTSCMCTTAQVMVGDELSPKFGMNGHGNTNSNWGYAVKPGEEFEVKAVFDPMAHGEDAVGPVARSIFIETSEVTTELKISGNVLSEEDFKELEVKEEISGFVFDEKEFDFGTIKQSGGIVTHDFNFTYTGDEEIKIAGLPASCACTSGEISKQSFKKGDKGVLTVKFDPNLHAEPDGKFYKTVNILTEPKLETITEVKVWVEIDLDLGTEAYKLKEEHND